MAKLPQPSTVAPRNFIGTPLEIEKLVEYQEHSVVSKQILDKKAGTLTLFAFDKGEGLSEHTAPYDASVLILDGKAEIKIDGKPHEVKKGAVIILPANVPHSVKAVERFKMFLIMIRSAE
jgi:quercetin dioxygenase-like cupin family protein